MQPRTVLAIAALTLCGKLLIAGPIAPPAGSVTPTYKTLTETEPRTAINATNTPGDADSAFRITQPGSYYLTANLTSGVSGKAGIEITASGVTIDLGGFTLDGSTLIGQNVTLDGIRSIGSIRAVTIRNGSILNWRGDGIDVGGVTGLVLTDVIVDSCGGSGIQPGPFARLERCTVLNNTSHGINIPAPGVIVRDCTAAQNDASGIRVAGIGTRIERCTVQSNSVHGIEVSTQSVIEDNVCTFNGLGSSVTDGAGIRISGSAARVVGNHTTSNDTGILATNDLNIVYQNFAALNSSDNYVRTGWYGFGYHWNTANENYYLNEAPVYVNFQTEQP